MPKKTFKTNRSYPHYYNGRFYNYPGEPLTIYFFKTVGIFYTSLLNRLKNPENYVSNWHTTPSYAAVHDEISITWLGHASFLIRVGGLTILTDPVLYDLTWFLPRLTPQLDCEQLPQVDFVLISHNHWDHFHTKSLRYLKHMQPTALVPHNDGTWFIKNGYERVCDAIWWQKFSFTVRGKEIKFTFLPARHWSQRTPFNRNKSLWGSWLIECDGKTIYFAGDTAYAPHFKEIAQECPQIDYALMPIGPCEPSSWLYKVHLNAEQSVTAFGDLKARTMIPMHWGTFHLGTEPVMAPLQRFIAEYQKQQDALGSIMVPRIGEQLILQEQMPVLHEQRIKDLIQL